MAEFKLGRLKFVWRGDWYDNGPGTAYVKDDIVKYGANSYVCVGGHSAAPDFYTDLDAGQWEILNAGVEWKTSEWTESELYKVNDLVKYGGRIYICVEGHISTASTGRFDIDFDAGKWQVFSDGFNWSPNEWTASTRYKVNDLVKHGGRVYICINDHTADADQGLGFDTDFTAGQWQVFVDGFEWSGEWTTSTYYKLNDLAIYGGRTYICVEAHQAAADFYTDVDASRWELITDGLQWKTDPWTESTLYKENDLVRYGGKIYICVDGHTATATTNRFDTDFDLGYWQLFSDGQQWKTSPWTASAYYKEGDLVRQGGRVYIAIDDHLANATAEGGFELDLAASKWQLFADGQQWKTNPWTESTYYRQNDLVRYGGRVYICVSGHVATSSAGRFDIDFDANKWQLFSDGIQWQGQWQTSTRYKIGDLVAYGGKTFICVDDHTSDSNQDGGFYTDAPTKWETSNEGTYWTGDWVVDTYYRVGDLVRYNGFIYVCNTGHTSAADEADGLEFDQSFWDLYVETQKYRGQWNGSANPVSRVATRYIRNDVVKFGGSLYICIVAHTSDPAVFDETKWEIWVEGLQFEDQWSSIIEYQAGDIVTYGGYVYTAVSRNTGVIPSSNPETWEIVTTGFKIRGAYSASSTYKVGDVVTYGGNTYVCIIDAATNETPFNSISSWEKIVSSFNWRNEWSEGVTYKIGDTVRRIASTYICVDEHLSTTANSPDLDNAGLYWNVVVEGDEANVMTRRGDLPTRNAVRNVRLPRGEPGQVLKVVGEDLAWEFIGVVPNVYYVATFGEDIPENGSNPETPFRSVAYAAKRVLDSGQRATIFVKTGVYEEITPMIIPANVAIVGDELRSTEMRPAPGKGVDSITVVNGGSDYSNNPYAEQLLTANRTFFQEEIVAWINDQIINNEGSFVGFSYDQAFCYRDVGLIVDALIYDLNFGGNSATRTAARRYWQGNRSLIEGQQTQTIAAIEYLRDLITDYIFTNSVEYAALQINASQVQLANDAEIGTDTTITELVSVLTGVITGGLPATPALQEPTNPLVINVSPPQISGGLIPVLRPVLDGGVITAIEIDSPGSGYTSAPVITFGTGNASATATLKDRQYKETNFFYMRDGSGLRNCTLRGLESTLGPVNVAGTQRPIYPAAYTSLDPGTGPGDEDAWIVERSPYVQNVTTFGTACYGLYVDGSLHNGGNRTIVCNDYTQVMSDGIGVYATNQGRIENVSVFCYYNHIGYLAENGGIIRSTNGNSSYGTYGVAAEGVDPAEVSRIAKVDNRRLDALISLTFVDGDGISHFEFLNAGENYDPTKVTFTIAGTGANDIVISDYVTQDGGVKEVRVLDTGESWLAVTNNAQDGDDISIRLSASDTSTTGQYIGMRIVINDGLGTGQYGNIRYFNTGTKFAYISVESFDHLEVTATTASTNVIEVGNSTGLSVNDPVIFTGAESSAFGGLSLNTAYYVTAKPSSTTITVSETEGGADLVLSTATGSIQLYKLGWETFVPGGSIRTTLDSTARYAIEPRVIFSTGSGASATAYVSQGVGSVAVTQGGIYRTTPTVSIDGSIDSTPVISAYSDLMDKIVAILNGGLSAVSPFTFTEPTGFDANYGYAIDLIDANRLFLTAEMTAYIAANYPLLTYDVVTCERDVGYILDALIYDLTYGTNLASLEAGYAYYSGAILQLGSTTEKTATLATYNYLKTVLDYVITENTLWSPINVSQTQQTTGFPGSAGSSTFAQARVEDIRDIILDNVGPAEILPDVTWASSDKQEAFARLAVDKLRLQNEVVAYVQDTFPNLDFNTETCFRDTGYIIDAVGYDMVLGSNFRSQKAAMAYYRGTTSATTVIENQLVPTVASQTYLKKRLTDKAAGATATATISGGIGNIVVRATGRGYTSVPDVDILSVNGAGSGAAATASITGALYTVTLEEGGTGFTTAPEVVVTRGVGDTTGEGAYISARITGIVGDISVDTSTSGFTFAPEVVITGGGAGAGGAEAVAVLNASVDSVTMSEGGNGYTADTAIISVIRRNNDTSSDGVAPGYANRAVLKAVVDDGIINSVTVTDGGADYTLGTVSITVVDDADGGSGAVLTPVIVGGAITEIQVTNGGSGYYNPQIVISDSGIGAGAEATANLRVTAGVITKIAVQSGGTGYQFPPIISIEDSRGPNNGEGATAAANLLGEVTAVNVINGGSGYTEPPVIIIENEGLVGIATASATITGAVNELEIIDVGRGYTAVPTISFAGDGSDAVATATITNILDTITITNPGSGYTATPVVVVSGGQGVGGFARAELDAVITEVTVTSPGRDYTLTPDVSFYEGDNFKSVLAGEAYYRNASGQVAIGSSQLPYTLAGIEYIYTLAQDIIDSNVIATPNQSQIDQVLGAGPLTNSVGVNAAMRYWVDATKAVIQNGNDNSVAAGLISLNREYIKAEIIAAVNNAFSGLVYDANLCARDVGIIVDALVYDLTNGTVTRSINAGVSYYRNASGLAAITEPQLSATLFAVNLIKELAQDIIFNSPTTSAQSQVPQIIDEARVAEATAETAVGNLVDLVYDAIANPVSAAGDSAGGDFAVAAELLTDNRTFIKAEVIEYIKATYPDFEYNQRLCARDVGLIVDAVAYDIVNALDSVAIANATTTFVVSDMVVEEGGSGYSAGVQIGFVPTSGGTGAAATAVITNGVITDFTITNPGSGYGTAPSVTITPDTGSGAFARAYILGGLVQEIRIIHPGSGYSTVPGQGPYITLFDPNNTNDGLYDVRTGDGVLDQPIFSNRGSGYLAATTTVSDTGDGYSDIYQVGEFIYVNNLTNIPTPGANVQFDGNDQFYKLVSVREVVGPAGIIGGRALIVANKEFIKAEVIAFVDSQGYGFNYDQATCERDTGYVIDAIAYDVALGTNYNAVTAGSSYLRGTTSAQYTLANEVDKTTQAYEYLRTRITALPSVVASSTALARANIAMNEILDIINNGEANINPVLFPNPSSATVTVLRAKNNLQLNKEFIKAEITGWIDYNYVNFNDHYDSATCERDIGYIIDAVTYDLNGGSNFASNVAGSSYYRGLESTGIVRTYQKVQTLESILRAKSLATSSIDPTLLTDANALFDSIYDIVENGLGSVPAVVRDDNAYTTANPNARNAADIMEANVAFYKAEIIQYITNNYPAVVYDQTACERDVGYIVDAIIYDTLYGGNYQSVIAGEAYYSFGTLTIDTADKAATLAAYGYLKSLLQDTVLNIAVTPLQVGVSQNTSLPASSAGVRTSIGALADNITAIINSGSGTVSTTYPSSSLESAAVQTTVSTLQSNKTTIKTGVTSYINTTFNGFTYDIAKCARDVGYIVDALTYDVLYGGNTATITNARAYISGLALQLGGSGEKTPTLNAYNFLAALISDIVQDVTVVPYNGESLTQDQTSGAAGTTEAGILTDLVTIITDVISAEDDSVVPTQVFPDITWATASIQSATSAINSNRTSLVTQTINYINSELVPFVYNKELCARDVGLIIDAISDDAFGDTASGIEAGKRYYASASALRSISGDQRQPTLDAIEKIRTLCSDIAQNITVSRLQLQELQVKEPQVTEGAEVLPAVNDTLDIIVDVITNGTTIFAVEDLLRDNKAYIQAEVLAFVNTTYPEFTYDQAICYRDVGLIVDAIAYDLFGGFARSQEAGLRYYTNASSLLAITDQLIETSSAISWIADVAKAVIQNQDPPVIYQAEVERISNLAVTATPALVTKIQDSVDTIVNIVENGLDELPAGRYSARLQLSPPLTVFNVPEHNTPVTVRSQYSQVRLSGHDFLNVGTGNKNDTNYPGIPVNAPEQANEVLEAGGGRCFYTSTDQDGNFRVGELFRVEQSTGIASLNADAFNLSGLNELSLGGVTLGGTGAVIREFSTDSTFLANSDNIVPTQRAIKTFIASQLGSGGGNLAVNAVTAGDVQITGTYISTALQPLTITAGADPEETQGVIFDVVIPSTSTSSGTIVVAGGAGILGDVNVGGDMTIGGDLVVNGDVVTVNTTTLDVEDINITIAKGAADAAAADGAGITVEGPTEAATILYAQADDSWNFNKLVKADSIQNTPIGSVTSASGKFTNVTVDTELTVTPTGTVTINPGLTGAMNNIDIGGGTPRTGAFTTLSANNSVTMTANAGSTNTTTGTLVVTGGVGISQNVNVGGTLTATAIQSTSIGTSTAASGAFTTLTANNAVTFTQNTASSSTTTGTLVVTGGVGVSGNIYAGGDIQIQGGDLLTNQTTFNLINATATTLNIGGAATTMDIGSTAATAVINLNSTKDSTSTTTGGVVIDGGVGIAKNLYVGGGAVVFSGNTSSTTTTTGTLVVTGGVGISQNVNMGGNLVVGGDLTVNGTTTTINATTITVDDINIELGSVASPTDTTANGGGITLRGATNKTITWVQGTGRWTSNQPFEASSIQNTPIGSSTRSSGAFTTLDANGNVTLGDANTDTITINASIANGSGIRTTTTAGNTVVFQAYDNDNATYRNMMVATANNTPTLTIGASGGTVNIDYANIGATSRGTGAFTTLSSNSTTTLGATTATSLNNTPIGATTRSTAAFTTLTANGATTFTQNTAATSTTTGTLVVTGGVGVSGAIYAGSLQNTPIGSTTRSTGAFTSLTANAAVTFTQNTASTTTGTGTLVVTGGVGVSGQVTASTVSATTISGTTVSGSTSVTGGTVQLTGTSIVTTGANQTLTINPNGSGVVSFSKEPQYGSDPASASGLTRRDYVLRRVKVWSIVTGATTLTTVANSVFVDTNSAAVTITLPSSPSLGDIATIVDYRGTFDRNPCYVVRNGRPINGIDDDLILDLAYTSLNLVYADTVRGWIPVSLG